jgi:hypothetical protein
VVDLDEISGTGGTSTYRVHHVLHRAIEVQCSGRAGA